MSEETIKKLDLAIKILIFTVTGIGVVIFIPLNKKVFALPFKMVYKQKIDLAYTNNLWTLDVHFKVPE